MAHVTYWQGFWGGGLGTTFFVNEVHSYAFHGFGFGDAISLTAHPGAARPREAAGGGEEAVLAVENVRCQVDGSGGRRLYFDVRNIGPSVVIYYSIGFAYVSA